MNKFVMFYMALYNFFAEPAAFFSEFQNFYRMPKFSIKSTQFYHYI